MDKTFTLRSIITGAVLAFIIGAGNIYNLMIIKGSYMALDFTTPAAIFFIFWISLLNVAFKKIAPRIVFSPAELILIYIMMIVSCSIPTMGLTLYLIPLISGASYYATPQNNWDTLVLPHLKKWMVLQDKQAIQWFYEGIPKGQSIPWLAWLKPLFAWLCLIMALYLVMIFIMVILRKQWTETEKINYPLTKAPLELIHATTNDIFKNRIFWLGFALPFTIGCINAIHAYYPLFPHIELYKNIPIFRRTLSMAFRLSFPMVGFSYFVSLPLSFSLWFFCLLTTIEQGVFNIMGFAQKDFLPYNSERPMLGWQSFGSLLVIVLYGLWMARKPLSQIVKTACGRLQDTNNSDEEIVSYPVAFWGMVIGLLFMFFWLVSSGLSLITAAFFLICSFIIFIGITRVVTEGGLAATRAPVISPVVTNSFFGSSRLGAEQLCSLGMTFVFVSDVRTFVMAAVANGLKMLQEIKKRRRLIFWAILISIIVTLASSIWATLLLGYKHGAINANHWFFVSGPQYPLKYIAQEIKHPGGTDWVYMGFVGIGALITVALQFMRTRFLWFPFHPLGFAFSTTMMTNALWFSIFASWFIKSMILKYGGAKVYEKGKVFFIGLIIGQFVVNGIWLFVDFFTKETGHSLFWA